MIQYTYSEEKDTRSGFGDALLDIGKSNSNVVALCCDLCESVKMTKFSMSFPNRFFQVGIAEANMIGIASGLTIGGYIPFTGTFAAFSTGRVYDQIRQSIAYSNRNVKICASHSGISLGEDGATHQMIEDIGMMKMLPNMVVINPCDYNQTKQATIAISNYEGPVYLRFGRPKVPCFFPLDKEFVIGKGVRLIEGTDVTIVSTGHMVWPSIEASRRLEHLNIKAEVINIHTIKPLDKKIIIDSCKKTKCLVVAEEHQQYGGLGESIASILCNEMPIPVNFVAIKDVFGESGKFLELMKKYNLTDEDIVKSALNAITKKKSSIY